MKKILAFILVLTMVFAFAACDGDKDNDSSEAASVESNDSIESNDSVESTSAEDPSAKSEGVMTYAEYDAAELDTEVVIETYVQAKQGWWENEGVGVATFYTQDGDGAYFLYNMPCTKEQYDALVKGTKIKVTGFKSEWAGEVEIIDATFEVEDGSFIAEAFDATALLGTDDLIKHQNQFVAFKGLTVAARKDADGNEVAFQYSWDGSGSHDANSDLYFDVTDGTNTYTFTVESYLCGNDTDVYAAVEGLAIGDKIDAEGFLYWYNGVNPHITAVTKA